MSGRNILLFDPQALPQSWNERMLPGEYAVLYSFQSRGDADPPEELKEGPACTIFSTLPEAEEHALHYAAVYPSLRCRIYGADGLGASPLREICGNAYRGDSEITARFRRWCGGILFLGGLALIALDAISGFSLAWPATIGARTFPVGLVLLVTELVIVWEAKRKASRSPNKPASAGSC